MAEVATKKSLNVVSSNNKSNDVCSVLSNKSLIDVDNNKSTLNNQLTSLCDEDEEEDERNGLSMNEELILDTGSDDKSLSELIENELALRICASKLESPDDADYDRDSYLSKVEDLVPEMVDENAAFIASEMIHYSVIEESHYKYQNGVTETVSDLDQVDSNLRQAWSPDLSSHSSPSHEAAPDDADKSNQPREQDEESGETVIVCSNKQDLSESIDCPEEFEEEPTEEEENVCAMSSKEAERVDLDEKDVSSPCDEELVMSCNAGEVTEVKDESEDKEEEEQNQVDHNWNDDAETREEVKSNGNTVTTTSCTTSTKTVTKKKKKIVEASSLASDASPNHTPKTKKTKKSKKSDLEKENISVNPNTEEAMLDVGPNRQVSSESIEFSEESDLSNVNVKSMTQTYVSETSRSELEKSSKEVIATGVSIKQLCRSFVDISNDADLECRRPVTNQERAKSTGDLRLCGEQSKRESIFTGVSVKALKSSFNKINASTKSVLHVRSVDAGKVQQQLNAVGQNGDVNPKCHSCGKVVFQMERTKAESLVWHKNCFRCVQCSKQLNVDNYESHESTLYCKPHFKELFLPKPVEETEQPVRPRKPELIIRENNPKELPPDVVRASDKPDLGLEELSTLNVKSRFQVFEKATTENATDVERLPSQVAVKRSPSILSKLAKFQAKGMDIGVSDETLNGIPYEESSESEEEVEDENENEENESDIVKAKRSTRERPMSFTKMGDTKNRWESISQQGRRETQREARKEEQATIRSRLFMGKQGKMKEMYQQAVADSERVTKINAIEEIQHSTNARSIKERFERGEPIAISDDEDNSGKPKPEKPDEEVIAAGIGRQSRSLFLELDASAAKSGRPVTPVNTKNTSVTRHARDAFMGRQASTDDVVRSSDTAEEVQVETSDISNKFKFFETYRAPEKQRKEFRFTPPRDGQVKMDSPEREIYRDPEVVRAEDKTDDVVHTDTARKMLSIFRQMEENATREELPDGPKPLKRFTPPPQDKFAKTSASDSEPEVEEENGLNGEDDDEQNRRDPNYVRASDKVEDDFLKQAQAQKAARAKTLRAKFEHWEETVDGKTTSGHVAEMEIGQGEQSSIESASSLRARFESLGTVQNNESPRTPKVKVSRFVDAPVSNMDPCEMCQKRVYPLEKVETNNKIFHKQCFRCLHCNCVLRMDTFTLNNGKLYCIPHFKQLFITRGNYDEGFGIDPHKNKWSGNGSNPASPIVVSNGDH